MESLKQSMKWCVALTQNAYVIGFLIPRILTTNLCPGMASSRTCSNNRYIGASSLPLQNIGAKISEPVAYHCKPPKLPETRTGLNHPNKWIGHPKMDWFRIPDLQG